LCSDFGTFLTRIQWISINRFFFKVTRENSTGIGRGPRYPGITKDSPSSSASVTRRVTMNLRPTPVSRREQRERPFIARGNIRSVAIDCTATISATFKPGLPLPLTRSIGGIVACTIMQTARKYFLAPMIGALLLRDGLTGVGPKMLIVHSLVSGWLVGDSFVFEGSSTDAC